MKLIFDLSGSLTACESREGVNFRVVAW